MTIIIGSTYLVWHFLELWHSPSFVGFSFLGIEIFISICSLFYWRTLLFDESEQSFLTQRSIKLDAKIDILIPTADENRDVLEKTIDSARLIQGMTKVYVLDDGKRDWLKNLCIEKDVVYVRREGSENAKAGNLNHALSFLESEFALILDADIIAKPEIILTAMPHFKDETVAIVQFPQEYSNLDSFQHWTEGRPWHDLSFGLIKVNPCRNFIKASYWVGSPSIIRISAIKQIGGVQTGSVTEDVQTTIALMTAGMWIKSLKEIKATGLAPHDYESYCIQRQRWSKGFFQLWWSKHSPLKQNLSLAAKIEWIGDFFYHMHMSFYFLVIQLLPCLIFIFKDETIIESKTGLIFWAVSFSLMNITNRILGGPLFRMIPFQTYMRLAMFPIIWGFIESIPLFKNEIFEVTPKAKSHKLKSRTIIYVILFSGLILINSITLAAVILQAQKSNYDVSVFFVALWCSANLFYLGLGAIKIMTTNSLNLFPIKLEQYE